MSASEKLKLLENDDIDGSWKLLGVLPQIVTVVEALERAEKDLYSEGLGDYVGQALAALDEALA